MTFKTEKYVRKPLPFVDAVQVNDKNIEDVAIWCQGDIRSGIRSPHSSKVERYIKVHVHNPLKPRQTQAYTGDWVLYAGSGFKVFTNKAFLNSFERVDEKKKNSLVELFVEAKSL